LYENTMTDHKIWFISDLHLDAVRPHITKLFFDFLDRLRQEQAESLYILGDLFEYWIGDDVLDSPEGGLFLPVLDALKQLSDSGTSLYFIHGNRDFLLGDGFCRMTGCEILPEQTTINLLGVPTLIMHGDTLCTDDLEYMKVRPLLRSEKWQKKFLALSIKDRILQAQAMRKQSRETTQSQQEDILDVNQETVEQVMHEAGVSQLIHGHTHRPATHKFSLDGQPAKRIVLGDWYDQSSTLEYSHKAVILR